MEFFLLNFEKNEKYIKYHFKIEKGILSIITLELKIYTFKIKLQINRVFL